MTMRCGIQKLAGMVAAAQVALLFSAPPALAAGEIYEGDVSDVRVIRRVTQHPYAWRIWQPFIVEGERDRDLIVAFGAMVNGKKDMGDILVTISRDDGDTWEEPVAVFDHRQRQGAIQFAYANPVLYRAPGQDIVWCFAMRCPIAFENSEESQLVAAFTADGGRSWTPVELAMHYTGRSSPMPASLRQKLTVGGSSCYRPTATRCKRIRGGPATTSSSAARACWSGSSKPSSPSPPRLECSCTKATSPRATIPGSSRS